MTGKLPSFGLFSKSLQRVRFALKEPAKPPQLNVNRNWMQIVTKRLHEIIDEIGFPTSCSICWNTWSLNSFENKSSNKSATCIIQYIHVGLVAAFRVEGTNKERKNQTKTAKRKSVNRCQKVSKNQLRVSQSPRAYATLWYVALQLIVLNCSPL